MDKSENFEIKQVIVWRKELSVRKGKMMAQASHAAMKVLLDRGRIEGDNLIINLTAPMKLWVSGNFKKIIVSSPNEASLRELFAQAESAGLPCAMVIDAGLTEFKNQPTLTCIAIGPAMSKDIDMITGNLPLL